MSVCFCRISVVLALVALATAFPPNDLSNFQNEYVCGTDVRLVRPQTVEDVQQAVTRYTYVQAMGGGWSWNRYYCSFSPRRTPEENDTSANIVMTTIRPLTIDINEEEMYAWVSAGVVIWDLMEYLGGYNTPLSPRGYALGSTPALTNQTIAGAIATGTHASSLTHGSLSNQVIGFRVVLANGTFTEILPDTYPLYFRAFQVNVGRLGVVTHVKMRIIKEGPTRRTTTIGVSPEDVTRRVREGQEAYWSTGILPEGLDGTWFNYNPVDGNFMVFNIRPDPEAETDDVDLDLEATQEFLDSWLTDRINAPVTLNRTENGGDIADGVSWEYPVPVAPTPAVAQIESIPAFNENVEATFSNPTNVSIDTHLAQLSQAFPDLGPIRGLLVDGYEVSFPVQRMADCFEGAIELLESQRPDTGLRGYALFRFVKRENGLLAQTNDQPRMYLIMDELVYYHTGRRSNIPFKNFMTYLLTSPFCAPARLHWAKPGWPDPGCWNGADDYPDTWCDFGCVVRDLDPTNKFMSDLPEIWNWEGADLERCCTPDGYDKSLEGCNCAVIPQRRPETCPAAPFYTNR